MRNQLCLLFFTLVILPEIRNNVHMKYYEVAPLTYIGKDTNVLTYSSESLVLPGILAIINLRNKKCTGLVLKEVAKPKFETKEIVETLFNKPVLTLEMIELAHWISKYYSATLVSVLNTMIPSGITKKRRLTTPKQSTEVSDSQKKLTPDQQHIFSEIEKDLSQRPQLIFGVTGSGKTEIYLQLIQKELELGHGVIVLVPEVSLTPQAMERYSARFGNRIAVLHSYLKETERFASWKAVLDGEKDIVIGSRSALFAPVKNLGLIIIDEAHENSYKQDQTPRYDATKVAEKMKQLTKCGLVFGTATPSIEMYYRAENGDLGLRILNKRIVQDVMPDVEIVDMRHEFQYGNKSIFSEKLQAAIRETLAAKGQIMLFINRRGMSTFVSCRDCGYVMQCPNCDIPLTFHYDNMRLTCHHCGHTEAPAVQCPKCKSMAIKYFGSGTQRVEQEIKKLFGEVRVSRMDKDTTKTTGAHEILYNNFAQNDVDIIIGTQMIAKGWDIPNVRLVGIVSADAMLNYPDFHANERAYNLITQIAGRTGRGEHEGKVIIQTYTPENPVFEAVQKHDYQLFYKRELQSRQELHYPPFAKMVKLLYNNESNEEAETKATELAEILQNEGIYGQLGIETVGPSPAFLPRLNRNFRWQIALKITKPNENNQIKLIDYLEKNMDNNWSIDIDPVSLM
jgi:primosomal protein N' (replication factor Y) (superfamily II helicase)